MKFQNFKIQNIVGSSDVRFAIDLDKVFENHKEFCSYEAEVFPGLPLFFKLIERTGIQNDGTQNCVVNFRFRKTCAYRSQEEKRYRPGFPEYLPNFSGCQEKASQ